MKKIEEKNVLRFFKCICSFQEIMEISGEFISLKFQQGKITHQEVDAIVNFVYHPEEEHMSDFDGVLAAAGQEITTEYENENSKDNRLVRRGVVVTTAGKLPCKKIFHVNVANHVGKMKDALHTALRQADREEMRSVAIPELRNTIKSYQTPAGDDKTQELLADILGISSTDFLKIITDFEKIESPLCLREIRVLIPVSSSDVKRRQASSNLRGFGDNADTGLHAFSSCLPLSNNF